jgi:predicted exporter
MVEKRDSYPNQYFRLLPETQQNPELAKTSNVSDQLNQKVFLVLESTDQQALAQATQLLQKQLQQSVLCSH